MSDTIVSDQEITSVRSHKRTSGPVLVSVRSHKRTSGPVLVNVHIRSTHEWREWLETTAKAHDHSNGGLIAAACRHYAEACGIPGPPARMG